MNDTAVIVGEQLDIEELASRLDQVRARMAELDPMPRQVLEEHIEAIDQLHAQALRTIVQALRDDERGRELLFSLVDDPVIRMVFSVHGLIRGSDPVSRAERALEQIRPGIAAHGGDVQLSHIDDGVAYVRLAGACSGCSLASVTMRNGVEKALKEAVPELIAVEVLANEPDSPELLEITLAGGGTHESAPFAEDRGELQSPQESGWFKTFPVSRIAPGTLEALSLRPEEGPSVEVVIVNSAGGLAAFVNACAHQGMPLDNALVSDEEGTLTCPWHGFCFDASTGECLSAPGAQLEPLPLRVADGHVWVRSST